MEKHIQIQTGYITFANSNGVPIDIASGIDQNKYKHLKHLLFGFVLGRVFQLCGKVIYGYTINDR